jgi:geranylgeranyl diphosphate synthase, type II
VAADRGGDRAILTDARIVEAYCDDVSRLVRRAMLDTIPDGEPHRWLYRVARAYPSRPGKAIRPALCVATSRAFGGRDRDILPVAVAIELLHNAFLVHDDIVDGSERRRGRPTLSAEYGLGLALNAGDALAVVSNQVLRRHTGAMDARLADLVLSEFDAMALRTLEGQAMELGWRYERIDSLEPEDYLDLIMHKTCWYTTVHPLRVGALVGSRGDADLRPMVRFGFYLGAAFQIQDDLLNLVGTEHEYGKEIDGDLYEGKRTLPLIHLLRNARGPDRDALDRYLALDRSQRSAAMVAEVRALLEAHGSIEFAAAYARGIAGAALDAFEAAFAPAPTGPHRDFVRALVPYMLDRRT